MEEVDDVLSAAEKDDLRQQLQLMEVITQDKMIHNFTVAKMFVYNVDSHAIR